MRLVFREAKHADLPELVKLLADDSLGKHREDSSQPINNRYLEAFECINTDPNNELVVVETLGADNQIQLVGMLQLTFISYLTHQGTKRCLVEGVRIHNDFRGQGFGNKLFKWVITRAKDEGCNMVQLTSNKDRKDALRFYQRLGFVDSHEGFKLVF